MSRILIADDDGNLRYSFQRMLDGRGYTFIEAADGREAVEQTRSERPDVVVMDVRMPMMSGLEAFEEIKSIDPAVPVIIMTAYGTTETAIEAMKRGAFDYILKPFEVEDMGALISRALQRTRQHDESIDVELPAEQPKRRRGQLIGSSRAMQRVYKAVGQVAESDVTVLILGETGTGKELVARTVHDHSRRSEGPFFAINCAAIPESLIEGELFGHEKGAYTGADQRKTGLLQAAAGGTVFLDEISEIPLGAQSKLLRFLQEGEILMLGSDKPVRIDARVIAASNRDLQAEVAAGRFRDDLFYRLNAVTITVPPLRERQEDLEGLVAHFVHLFNAEQDKAFGQVSGEAIAMLRSRRWPGNVRELKNLTRKAVIVGQGPLLLPEHFFSESFDRVEGDGSEAGAGSAAAAAPSVEQLVRHAVDMLRAEDRVDLLPRINRIIVDYVYRLVDGNQVRAAKVLGISRNTLRSRLEKYGIELGGTAGTEPEGDR
ncbi:MAG: sigma-54-dependent Fis family transcriptional regulator [Deltaproteobacteria bacterium]|jgi:two-component system NtrC family response regulator/two-component system nitrogen regulation response regulator GlnG|nr:sigma-54-dependent Fis family transcriptional regulator [Deltaproteobacteria bacterium]MBW2532822.1 sigma-54-dependent Fis family transcriptional regulator [Deltaproteobacteria bacterium]